MKAIKALPDLFGIYVPFLRDAKRVFSIIPRVTSEKNARKEASDMPTRKDEEFRFQEEIDRFIK